MDVTRENIDELNAKLRVKIISEDYEERVKQVLTDHKKKMKLDAQVAELLAKLGEDIGGLHHIANFVAVVIGLGHLAYRTSSHGLT